MFCHKEFWNLSIQLNCVIYCLWIPRTSIERKLAWSAFFYFDNCSMENLFVVEEHSWVNQTRTLSVIRLNSIYELNEIHKKSLLIWLSQNDHQCFYILFTKRQFNNLKQTLQQLNYFKVIIYCIIVFT